MTGTMDPTRWPWHVGFEADHACMLSQYPIMHHAYCREGTCCICEVFTWLPWCVCPAEAFDHLVALHSSGASNLSFQV
jgi:hypothetical protein